MKYFLAMFVLCTFSAGAMPPPKGGINLGTLEMFSTWYPAPAVLDMDQVCLDVVKYYNELNRPRGYWGRLLDGRPVSMVVRTYPNGDTEKQFFCHLRVKKFDIPESFNDE